MAEKKINVTTENNNVIIRREVNAGEGKIFGDNNKVWISGIIEEEFQYDHEVWWEKFYRTRVIVARQSGNLDYVPIIVSDLLMGSLIKASNKGKYAEVAGQFRSHNYRDENGKWHLNLYLFVKAINIYESEEEFEDAVNANLIYLEGYICKQPTYRTTPFGREITDLLLAIPRTEKKSDYIPCIAWGRNAQYASYLEVGNKIKLYGRVQSREYLKRVSPDSEEGETRIAYEISIMRMIKVEELMLEG